MDFTDSPGDLLVTIKVKPDKYFKKEGYNIMTEHKLSIPKVKYL